METAAPVESAPTPSQPVGQVSQSEQAFLDSNRSVAPKEQTSTQPTEQTAVPVDPTEQLPGEQPNDLPPTVEYKIKDIHGNEKTVSPEWMAKYFQAVGQESLLPLINDEKNAPLLLHIAERTLKLNQAYQDASRIRPEYESYKGNVETYFEEIRKAPDEGFERMMFDMGLSETDQEAIIEKILHKYIEKREMSPEQRATQAAIRERQRLAEEAESYRSQVEQMKIEMETQQRAPVYQTGMSSALTEAGLDINDSTWATMVQMCKQQYGNQKEPISQEQFNAVAKHIAQIGMSFKKATQQQPAQPPKRVVTPGYKGKTSAQPITKEPMTESQWLEQHGMKQY